MLQDLYIIKHGKKLRCGYTTGSCAAAAAKGAALMYLSQSKLDFVELDTPAGVKLNLKLHDTELHKDYVQTAIIKDAGDDHDATDKVKIIAKVKKRTDQQVVIKGGVGIGQITKKALWGKVGEPAINPGPTKMIHKELKALGAGGWEVCLSCPEGVTIAKNTLNERLGIVGGISILGTSGIVEPMSDEAWKKTLYLEIDAIAEQGKDEIILYIGNYSKKVIEKLALDTPAVKISNYIGDSLLYAKEKLFKQITLVGHIGKLCKLAIGAFNTHSKLCDLRMESFVYYLALAGAPLETLNTVSSHLTAEEALKFAMNSGYSKIISDMEQGCVSRIRTYLKAPGFPVKVIIFSFDQGDFGGLDNG